MSSLLIDKLDNFLWGKCYLSFDQGFNRASDQIRPDNPKTRRIPGVASRDSLGPSLGTMS